MKTINEIAIQVCCAFCRKNYKTDKILLEDLRQNDIEDIKEIRKKEDFDFPDDGVRSMHEAVIDYILNKWKGLITEEDLK